MQTLFTIFLTEEGFIYEDKLYTSNSYNKFLEQLYADGCDNSTQLEFRLYEGYGNSQNNTEIMNKTKGIFCKVYDDYADNVRKTDEELKKLEKKGLVEVLVGEDGKFYYEWKKP